MTGQDVIVSLGACVALLLVATAIVKACQWFARVFSELLDGSAIDIK